MGSRNSDDPMDLGPFLQNYVMKNPFDQLNLVTDKQQNAPAAKPNSPEKSTLTSSSRNKFVPILPKPNLGAPESEESGLAAEQELSSKSELEENKENGSKDDSGDGTEEEREGSASPHAYVGGHVGSNVTYAINLRQNKVSDVHEMAQMWLWRNYKFVSSYKGLFAVTDLLSDTKQHFRHITSVVLSRIMKFTFPDCPKLTNKSGVYYQGLIAKPDESFYSDLHMLAAASAVQNGLHTVETAAKTYYICEKTVASLAFWEDTPEEGEPNYLPPENYTADNEPSGSRGVRRKSLRGSKKQSDDEEWKPPIKVEKETSRVTRSPRLRVSPRDKLNALIMAESADSQEESDVESKCNNNQLDRDNSSASLHRSSRTRKRKSTPLKNASSVKSARLVDEHEGTQVAGFPVLRDVLKTGNEPKRQGNRGNDNSQVDPADNEKLNVRIKEEPNDCGYGDGDVKRSECSQGRGSGKATAGDCGQGRAVGGVEETNSGGPAQTLDVGHAKETLAAIEAFDKVPVHHLTLRMVLEKIQEQKLENKTLEEELRKSKQEIQSLQGQLKGRDEQLAELATSFFSLNNQFQMIAHQFKMALSTSALDRNLDDTNENDSPDDR